MLFSGSSFQGSTAEFENVDNFARVDIVQHFTYQSLYNFGALFLTKLGLKMQISTTPHYENTAVRFCLQISSHALHSAPLNINLEFLAPRQLDTDLACCTCQPPER